MIRPRRPPTRLRRGFSLLEIQAAFIVLGFSMAALVPFAVAQLKLIAALENRLPPNTTYVLMTRDHGMVSLLANGGGKPTQNIQAPASGTLQSDPSPPSTGTTPNYITAQPPASVPEGGSLDMMTTVVVKKVP